MALQVEQSILDRIVRKHYEDPLTTDLRDEISLLREVDLEAAATELPNLREGYVDPDTALWYGRNRLPVFMEAKFAKIGGALIGIGREGIAPNIRWTVINAESWAVGTLAAMQVVDTVAQAQGYETLLESENGNRNEWGFPQWTTQLSFRPHSPESQ